MNYEKYIAFSKKDQYHIIKFILKRTLRLIYSQMYPFGNTVWYLLNHLMHWLQPCLLLHSSKLQKFHLFPYSCELEHLSNEMKNRILKNNNIYCCKSKYWGANVIYLFYKRKAFSFNSKINTSSKILEMWYDDPLIKR